MGLSIKDVRVKLANTNSPFLYRFRPHWAFIPVHLRTSATALRIELIRPFIPITTLRRRV